MNRTGLVCVLLLPLAFLSTSAVAGPIAWFRGRSAGLRYERTTASNLTSRAVAVLQKKASLEQSPAIQVGTIHGSVNRTVEDIQWFGSVGIRIKANYAATYGLPYALLEKGIRVEKGNSSTGLIVIVSAPIPLSVAPDTSSVYIEDRDRSGLRTWRAVPTLEVEAYRGLTSLTTKAAEQRCHEPDVLDMTRSVIRDVVLDMVGDLYSIRVKRALAANTEVLFEHELPRNHTRPLAPIEIDLGKRTQPPMIDKR